MRRQDIGNHIFYLSERDPYYIDIDIDIDTKRRHGFIASGISRLGNVFNIDPISSGDTEVADGAIDSVPEIIYPLSDLLWTTSGHQGIGKWVQ